MNNKSIDRKFRLPRLWSNIELRKFASLFKGHVVNVSGWKDQDKEGGSYKEYFLNAETYMVTNYKTEARGFQGKEGEIYLDLTNEIPDSLVKKFDVVFNHTVLEHIYNVSKAFENLCLLSKDIVIIVVPFLQQMHGDYGDYWRFTPSTIKKMFEENGLKLLYLSFNSHANASVYIFAIGSKHSDKWAGKIVNQYSYEDKYDAGDGFDSWIGCHAISNLEFIKFKKRKKSLYNRILRRIKSFYD